MVKIQKKKLPKALMQLTLEVEDEAVQVAIAEATAELVKKSKIPGFRPGKAPKHIIEKNYDEYQDSISIRKGYAVTDKADGERYFLIIHNIELILKMTIQDLLQLYIF